MQQNYRRDREKIMQLSYLSRENSFCHNQRIIVMFSLICIKHFQYVVNACLSRNNYLSFHPRICVCVCVCVLQMQRHKKVGKDVMLFIAHLSLQICRWRMSAVMVHDHEPLQSNIHYIQCTWRITTKNNFWNQLGHPHKKTTWQNTLSKTTYHK